MDPIENIVSVVLTNSGLDDTPEIRAAIRQKIGKRIEERKAIKAGKRPSDPYDNGKLQSRQNVARESVNDESNNIEPVLEQPLPKDAGLLQRFGRANIDAIKSVTGLDSGWQDKGTHEDSGFQGYLNDASDFGNSLVRNLPGGSYIDEAVGLVGGNKAKQDFLDSEKARDVRSPWLTGAGTAIGNVFPAGVGSKAISVLKNMGLGVIQGLGQQDDASGYDREGFVDAGTGSRVKNAAVGGIVAGGVSGLVKGGGAIKEAGGITNFVDDLAGMTPDEIRSPISVKVPSRVEIPMTKGTGYIDLEGLKAYQNQHPAPRLEADASPSGLDLAPQAPSAPRVPRPIEDLPAPFDPFTAETGPSGLEVAGRGIDENTVTSTKSNGNTVTSTVPSNRSNTVTGSGPTNPRGGPIEGDTNTPRMDVKPILNKDDPFAFDWPEIRDESLRPVSPESAKSFADWVKTMNDPIQYKRGYERNPGLFDIMSKEEMDATWPKIEPEGRPNTPNINDVSASGTTRLKNPGRPPDDVNPTDFNTKTREETATDEMTIKKRTRPPKAKREPLPVDSSKPKPEIDYMAELRKNVLEDWGTKPRPEGLGFDGLPLEGPGSKPYGYMTPKEMFDDMPPEYQKMWLELQAMNGPKAPDVAPQTTVVPPERMSGKRVPMGKNKKAKKKKPTKAELANKPFEKK